MGTSTKRPTEPTPAIVGAILGRIAEGESLKSICRDESLPSCGVFYRWLLEDDKLADRYARAREDQAEALADEILDIADDSRNDFVERENERGEVSTAVDTEHIQRSKLRVDSRKWLASKLLPKKYGDKLLAEHSGPDGGAMKFETVVRKIVDPKDGPT